MKAIVLRYAAACAVLAVLAGCASTGRGHGPVDAFTFQAGVNKGLARDVVGAIDERVEPKEIRVVVPAGTDMYALVATLSLTKEAEIAVVSTGSRIVQQNGATPNDFSVPVMYSIAVPGEKQPWTYRVFVREAESNARLGAILTPQGTILQPAFNPTVRSYTLDVPFAATRVQIQARGQTATLKSVTINGAETLGSNASAQVDFTSGQSLTVTIATLAEDGLTQDQYVVTIRRGAPDSNATLASLDLQNISLAPVFAPARLNYKVVVPFDTKQVVVHARPASPVATLTLGSAAVVSGGRTSAPALRVTGNPAAAAGAQVDFSTGDRLALVISVTAEDQGVQQYLVDIQRAPPDRNNLLADLSLGSGTGDIALLPSFAPNRFQYVANVPYSTQKVTLAAATQGKVATASIEAAAASGSTRGSVTFTGDLTSKNGAVVDFASPAARLVLAVSVTAQDGSVQRYSLDLRRAPPDSNASLASLTATAGNLTPPFSDRAVSYSLLVPAATDSVKVTVAAASPVASITVVEQPDVKPAATQTLTLAVAQGSAVVLTLVVSAEDGSQRLFRLRVSREAAPAALDGNALLQSLLVSGAQVSPAFDPSLIIYDARMAANVDSVAVIAQAQSQLSTVAIDGQPAGKTARNIPVQAGATRTVLIDVTAQSGAVVRYTLRVTRDAATKPPEGGTVTPPAGAGDDHVIVTAKNLRLQQRETSALSSAGDQVGDQARVTVRYYRTVEVITQYFVPVDVKQQGGATTISFSSTSNAVSLNRERMVEVETAIQTSKGLFLYYTEAQASDSQVSIDVPFLLYGDNPQVRWPALGSPVQVGGYLSKLPLTKDRAVDKEDFDKNANGENSITVAITDARTGTSYGQATVSTKPGQGRSRTLVFGKSLQVTEGSSVKCVLSATAKNGKAWAAADTTQVWTTRLNYAGGFVPVFLFLSDDLAPQG